jgi:hypothetical protein
VCWAAARGSLSGGIDILRKNSPSQPASVGWAGGTAWSSESSVSRNGNFSSKKQPAWSLRGWGWTGDVGWVTILKSSSPESQGSSGVGTPEKVLPQAAVDDRRRLSARGWATDKAPTLLHRVPSRERPWKHRSEEESLSAEISSAQAFGSLCRWKGRTESKGPAECDGRHSEVDVGRHLGHIRLLRLERVPAREQQHLKHAERCSVRRERGEERKDGEEGSEGE